MERSRRWRALVAAVCMCGVLALQPRLIAASTALPDGFVEEEFARGLTDVTALRYAPTGELFVLGKSGQVWIVRRGMARAPEPALTIPVDIDAERGLLGIDFDPEFAVNGHIYVQYTVPEPPVHNRVSRFTALDGSIDPSTELVLIELPEQVSGYHVGGAVTVANDGTLLIGVGDNTRSDQAQVLDSLLGKVLRVHRDGTIPSDNPFVAEAEGVSAAIWALGLRNPFTIAVDPASDRVFINDTGQVTAEEVNLGRPGANYGWPQSEGPTDLPGVEPPLHSYAHGSGADEGCGIDGGVVYRGDAFPSQYQGSYFFIDYCARWIGQLDSAGQTFFARDIGSELSGASQVVAMEVSPEGSLLWLDRALGSVFEIRYQPSDAPVIGQHPRDREAEMGQVVTLEVRASGKGALRYQWMRDGAAMEGEVESILRVIASRDSDGAAFTCEVTSPYGRAVSSDARIVTREPIAIYQPYPPESWVRGETRTYEVTVTNGGLQTWFASGDRPVRLGVSFGGPNDDISVGRVTDERFALPRDVPPGDSITLSLDVTAPEEPGQYILRHQMVIENVGWFWQPSRSEVRVVDSPLPIFLGLGAFALAAPLLWYLSSPLRRRARRRPQPRGHGLP